MRTLIFLTFLTLFTSGIAAQTPRQQGLIEYTLIDGADEINYYVFNPDISPKTKVFLYIQGSGSLPMVNGDDNEICCYNNYPKKLMTSFPKDYAFVYIQKVGLPYYVRNLRGYKPGQRFVERNNVLDRAAVAGKVIDHLIKKVYPKARVIAVLGHSEGSDVAAKLAASNGHITHLGFSAGNGPSQPLNEIILIRRMVHRGEISSADAENRIEALYLGLKEVYNKPESTADQYNGDTNKWHTAINNPPLENLLKLKIPIFVTIGGSDEKVPVEAADYIRFEFIRHGRNNLTYKVYPNSDHSYVETRSDGKKIDHWAEMFMDFLKFIEQNPRPRVK